MESDFVSWHKLKQWMLTQIAAIVENNLKSVVAWILMLVQLWFGLREHKCGSALMIEGRWSPLQ